MISPPAAALNGNLPSPPCLELATVGPFTSIASTFMPLMDRSANSDMELGEDERTDPGLITSLDKERRQQHHTRDRADDQLDPLNEHESVVNRVTNALKSRPPYQSVEDLTMEEEPPGNILTFGLFLSPVPTFWKIIKRKDVEDFSPIPYLATLMNCILWVFYGLPFVHPNSLLIVTINGFGLVVEVVYIIILFIYGRKLRKKMSGILAAEITFMAVVALIVLLVGHTVKTRSKIVGSLCVIFGICMYAAPLSVMKLVVATKSVKYMPFFLSLAGCLNGIDWAIYGFIHFDIFVVVSY
ncbi:hypothetical protein J5N97_004176 [Dioscorea zingiberensis]|uniref:Bidirectional sugar transporter SWEET n=1 Tax=Dioscorea zingiberensis TaxID=325984 RepID=A0A9D5D5K8_9LILI|nr:hypothetical protein J5N97_004176 [Dioscorea zingiberensis]